MITLWYIYILLLYPHSSHSPSVPLFILIHAVIFTHDCPNTHTHTHTHTHTRTVAENAKFLQISSFSFFVTHRILISFGAVRCPSRRLHFLDYLDF